MNCHVCGRRRIRRNLIPLAVPVEFVVNYATGERMAFPAGTLVCDTEWRKISTVGGGSTSEGQSISFSGGRFRRADGNDVFVTS